MLNRVLREKGLSRMVIQNVTVISRSHRYCHQPEVSVVSVSEELHLLLVSADLLLGDCVPPVLSQEVPHPLRLSQVWPPAALTS